MKFNLLRAALLLPFMYSASPAHADSNQLPPDHCADSQPAIYACVPPSSSSTSNFRFGADAQYSLSASGGMYLARTTACPTGAGNECLWNVDPPTPASVVCTTYAGGGALCEAWPKSVELGLITFVWQGSPGITVANTNSTASSEMGVDCAPRARGKVSVLLISPGGGRSLVSTTITCGDL